ncbi:MAG: hypothetical protein GX811_11635, partial [Lentisphaerae bacterium]|nr:hypothetical protein [Lentisphaerota bacterium]
IAPTNLGTGGGSYIGDPGGGAVILKVAGELRHDGSILANAIDGGGNRGAGGSVFLTAGTLIGDGYIEAHGGCFTVHSPGGGGRISLVVTNGAADFSGFTGWTTTYSGRGMPSNSSAGGGAPGTVYRETALQGPGKGIVTIDNYHFARTGITDVPPQGEIPEESIRVTFVLTNNCNLILTNDYTVGDIYLSSTGAVLDLNFKTLKVNTEEHELGPGKVENMGQIIWWTRPPGSVLMFW